MVQVPKGNKAILIQLSDKMRKFSDWVPAMVAIFSILVRPFPVLVTVKEVGEPGETPFRIFIPREGSGVIDN